MPPRSPISGLSQVASGLAVPDVAPPTLVASLVQAMRSLVVESQQEESDELRASREACEASLYEFMKQAWHIIEPVTPLVPGWHIEAVCKHLEAVTDGLILNLCITIPVGSTKSRTACVMWPAWAWTKYPSLRWLFASHNIELALRDSVYCRTLIQSDWYQERWGHVFQLTGDQNVKGYYSNTRMGHRLIRSAGGGATGQKGDILVVDDPHDAKQVESEVQRNEVLKWWGTAFYNRVNDPRTGRRVVMGQRTHIQDLQGHVIDGGFMHLDIPEEFEPARKCLSRVAGKVFWEDPRTEAGEWMRPERFGLEQKKEAIATMMELGYAAQHQQRPVPAGGALFKADWFQYYDDLGDAYRFCDTGEVVRKDHFIVFTLMDTAGGTKKTNDYTAIGTFAHLRGKKSKLLLLHMVRERIPYESIIARLNAVCEVWHPMYAGIEQEGWAIAAAKDRSQYRHVPTLKELKPVKNKYNRNMPAVLKTQNGEFYIPSSSCRCAWVSSYLAELLAYTGMEGRDDHDDQVDVTGYAALECEQYIPASFEEEAISVGGRRR